MVLYYHDWTPGKHKIYILHTVEGNTEGFTNHKVTDSKKSQQAYVMVGLPTPLWIWATSKRTYDKNWLITIDNICNYDKRFGPGVGSIYKKKQYGAHLSP